MNERKYNEVLSLSQLTDDLKTFVNGDETQIGEKGVTLSGGQKMRIALARALYADSDIYLLDDPLAALDANVGKDVMCKCIKEYLQGKTRIVVTHSLQYLNYAEQILLVKAGKVVFNGTYKDIQGNSCYNEFIKRNSCVTGSNDVNKVSKEGITTTTTVNVNSSSNMQKHNNKSNNVVLNVNANVNALSLQQQQQQSQANKGKQMNVYTKYIHTNGGYTMCIIVCVFVLIWQISRGISDIYLVNWTKSKSNSNSNSSSSTIIDNTNYYLYYTTFAIIGSLFIYIRLTYISKHTLKGSSKLHTDMINSIIHAPINLYHDIIPRGQIMNQLSKDLSVVDFLGSVMFGNILSFGASFIFSLLICSLYQTYCLLFLPVLLFGGIYLMKFYLKGCRQVTRLESESRTPLINLINEVSSGSDTIRAFNTQQSFIDSYYAYQDTFLKTNLFLNGVNLWFGLMVYLLIFSFKVSLIILTLYLRHYLPSEVIGLLLAYSIQIQNSLESFLQCFSTFENAMLAFQRCTAYTRVISERPYKMEKDNELHVHWPLKGKIDFNMFSMRYRPTCDNVLHGVDMHIHPGEKIGICGRTGSGKSSLALSLFRIIEASEGSISIDDVNINEIGLHKLRQAITIIPQEPCLFEGTLRYNIDPTGKYTDEEIETVMKRFSYENEMQLDMNINVNGNNLSVGQKQIVCFIRAVLRNSKVMVIDEGTASIDYKNEEIILKELINAMKDSTVIVIAHRIKTVMKCDKVLVLHNGKVAEYGNPNELKKDKTSLFYKLYQRSYLEHK
jgi:ABC-type multidrug transport system fused ATPase/permease subunit